MKAQIQLNFIHKVLKW